MSLAKQALSSLINHSLRLSALGGDPDPSWAGLCNSKFWVKRFPRLEDAESQMQKLAHGRDHHLHGAFTVDQEAIAKGRNDRIVPLGYHRWQIKRFAQQGIPRLGDWGFSGPLARLADAGIEASVGDHLFDRMEPV